MEKEHADFIIRNLMETKNATLEELQLEALDDAAEALFKQTPRPAFKDDRGLYFCRSCHAKLTKGVSNYCHVCGQRAMYLDEKEENEDERNSMEHEG